MTEIEKVEPLIEEPTIKSVYFDAFKQTPINSFPEVINKKKSSLEQEPAVRLLPDVNENKQDQKMESPSKRSIETNTNEGKKGLLLATYSLRLTTT